MAAMGALARGDHANYEVANTPGGVEAQEKRGQEEQEAKETLPITMNGCKKEDFEKLGFKFFGKTDRIFWQCSFPPGWKKRATGHSLWSNLIDDKDRNRGSIFFKAAFYDYDAFISLNPRYIIKRIMLDAKKEEIFDRKTGEFKDGKRGAEDTLLRFDVVDTATEESVFASDLVERKAYISQEAEQKKCDEWIAKNYPDWKSPSAYWD